MRSSQRRHVMRFALSVAVALTALSLFLTQSHRLDAHNQLRIWFFDVGQGDAIFIETPDGHQLLVDGGPSDQVLDKLGSVLWPWDRSLDAIFLTHPHADHVAGLVPVLEHYSVETIYDSGALAHTNVMDDYEQDASVEPNARHERLHEGTVLTFGEVTLRVIAPTIDRSQTYPDDPNEASLVLLLTYHDTTVLLTGDAIESWEPVMAEAVGDIDVLKVAHHGSLTSSSVPFLEIIKPEVAVISVGEGNTYGHPHPVVLSRLREAKSHIYRTDLDGDLFLSSRGGEPFVESSPLPF